MKKQYVFILSLCMCMTAGGQTLDDIAKMVGLDQSKKAQEAIDNYLSIPENVTRAEAWYFKGRIYNSVSKDPALNGSQALKMKTEAFQAFRKYQQMDAKAIRLIIESHGSFFDLYNGFFDIGRNAFYNKDYPLSYQAFNNALMTEEFVAGKKYEYNGFRFPALDTFLILNAAIAATQANETIAAMNLYRKLTDANLSAAQFLVVYLTLAEYYLQNGDDVSLYSILEKGKRFYPDDDYWAQVELVKNGSNENKNSVIAKYEALLEKDPTNFTYAYNLSVELYNLLYNGNNQPANVDAWKNKLTQSLAIAIQNDKSIAAKVLKVRFVYNDAVDIKELEHKITGAAPEDEKKKNDLKLLFGQKIDEGIYFATAVENYFQSLPTLSESQKENYKMALEVLVNCYSVKKDTERAAAYAKKRDAVK